MNKITMSATTEPSFGSAKEEDKAFQTISSKGADDGLFRACMKAIRSAHFQSNKLRAAIVLTGLFTDKTMYREVISMFYVVTREAEAKLQKMKDLDPVCAKMAKLGYSFAPAYEKDLAYLYGSDNWKESVDLLMEKNDSAREYLEMVRAMETGNEIAGAVFVLWGALIIGGGAATMPRIKSAFGPSAIHIFEDVTGPGREDRKKAFIQIWDSLAKNGSADFDKIVASSQRCMQGNNDILSSLKRNPWWLPWAVSGTLAVLSASIFLWKGKLSSPPSSRQ